jgi:hypothetical protein
MLGEGTEDQCPDRRADQRGAGQEAALQPTDMVDAERGQHQGQHHPNRGQVVAVGEDAHARREQSKEVESLDRLFVEMLKRVCCDRHRLPLLNAEAGDARSAPRRFGCHQVTSA